MIELAHNESKIPANVLSNRALPVQNRQVSPFSLQVCSKFDLSFSFAFSIPREAQFQAVLAVVSLMLLCGHIVGSTDSQTDSQDEVTPPEREPNSFPPGASQNHGVGATGSSIGAPIWTVSPVRLAGFAKEHEGGFPFRRCSFVASLSCTVSVGGCAQARPAWVRPIRHREICIRN